MTDECGGRRFAENEILSCLGEAVYATPPLLSILIGLPRPIVLRLLHHLEDRGFVRVGIDGRTWRINEEAFI